MVEKYSGAAPDKYSFRCRAVGMLRILRYLATVRRAMSMPCSLSFSTISSSFSGLFLSSFSMIALSFSFTASQDMSSPSALVVPPEKKRRRGKTPLGV